MPAQQLEFFDPFIRQSRCRCCQRKLHPDQKRRYRTRIAGLCFVCLREFEKFDGWSIEEFLKEHVR